MEEKRTLELVGKPVADRIYEETRHRWGEHLTGQTPPCLASVAVGEDGPFRLYQRQQKRTAERHGITFREVVMPVDASEFEIRRQLEGLSADPGVHGILLQHPLPKPLDFFTLASVISPEKDIDGVGMANLGRLVARKPLHVPAVALATIEILKFYGLSPSRKRVTVLGRSETVGLPTALLLLMKGQWGDATVTVAHSGTPELDQVILESEIVIACAGKPGIVHRSNVRRGATVVDVGISPVADPSKPGGVAMVGDAKREELLGWAGAITPVPGGVGPVTVAELMRNTVVGWEMVSGGR